MRMSSLGMCALVACVGLVGCAADGADGADGVDGVDVPVSSTEQAVRTTSFTGPGGVVWGTISWTSSHSYSLAGTIYGTAAGPGYYSRGEYFEGNARIYCGSTPSHSNYADGIQRSFSNSTNCSVANIQQVMIVFTQGGGTASVGYYDNPLN